MLRTSLRAGSALALMLAVAPAVSAQPRPAPPATRPAAAPPATAPGTAPAANAQAESGFRAKSVIGSSVTLQGGSAAGTVEDFVLNNDGVIEYLIVNNGGKLVTVPWDAAKFNWTAQQPSAVINVTPQQFQTVPTYTATTYPNFYAPTYRTDIYRAYGLTPGQSRRIERRIERRNP